jgi:hypothetical protein
MIIDPERSMFSVLPSADSVEAPFGVYGLLEIMRAMYPDGVMVINHLQMIGLPE